jgi:hypothetical protein
VTGRPTAAQERERAYGLPVSVMLAPDAASKAKMELGFIEFGTHRQASNCDVNLRHAC